MRGFLSEDNTILAVGNVASYISTCIIPGQEDSIRLEYEISDNLTPPSESSDENPKDAPIAPLLALDMQCICRSFAKINFITGHSL